MSSMRKRLALVPAVALMLALGGAPAAFLPRRRGSRPPGCSQYDVACYQVSHKGGSR